MGKMIFLVEANTKAQALNLITVKWNYWYNRFLEIGHTVKALEYANTFLNYESNMETHLEDAADNLMQSFTQTFQKAAWEFNCFRDNTLALTKFEAGNKALDKMFHLVAAGLYKGVPTMCAFIIPFKGTNNVECCANDIFSILRLHRCLRKFKDFKKTWVVIYEVETIQ